MLPGVELARRRRVHYHGDGGGASSAAAGADHHHYAHAYRAGAVAGPALAARIRLEEKLRGAVLPPASPSRWSRLIGEQREGRAATAHRRGRQEHHHQQQEHRQEQADLWPPAAPTTTGTSSPAQQQRRAELRRTLSMVDVCAVCLEEVGVGVQVEEVTRLPCSHKYHSQCVLPWLAAHPDCPCCRALVPSSSLHAILP